MQYRNFGATQEKVSVLGFGCMRLPLNSDDTKDINEAEAIRMIRHSIDQGVNYIDTAWPYHGEMSEPLVGKALQDGYRDKVHLATKLPSWLINDPSDFDKYLNEQLDKLQTDHIDFYLVHTLNSRFWANLKEQGLFEFLDRLKDDPRVKHVGFSFHDDLPLFKEIVDAYDWSFCQVQLNYLDRDYQAGYEGMKYAADKGLGIVIMEPVRGGNLAHNIPQDIRSVMESTVEGRSPVDWALRWLWNMPEVHVILSGMSEMPHVVENMQIAADSQANAMVQEELDAIERVTDLYQSRIQVNCTQCKYCMPCPHGVLIPRVFEFYNNAFIFEDKDSFKDTYNRFIPADKNASACVACGVCEPKCPQNIPIIDSLAKTKALFE